MASLLGPRTSANDTSAGGGKHSDDDRRPGTHPVPPMSCWHAPAMRRDITGPRQQHGSTTGAGFSECFGTVLDPSSRVLMFVSIFLIKVPAWVYWRCGSCPSSSWRSSGLFSTRQPGVAFFAHVGGFIFGLLAVGGAAGADLLPPSRRFTISAAPIKMATAAGYRTRPR
jgi:hypothetical protein